MTMQIPAATIKIPPPSRPRSFEPEFANTGIGSPMVDWVSPVITSDVASVVVDESGTVVSVEFEKTDHQNLCHLFVQGHDQPSTALQPEQ